MNVLLFSDLHGEISQLQRLWSRTDALKPDLRIFLGDLGDSGTLPVGTLQQFMERGVIGLLGNNDNHYQPPGLAPPEVVSYFAGFARTHAFKVGAISALAFHGSPFSRQTYLYPHTPLDTMRKYFAQTGSSFLCCGHNHRPFARRMDGALWLLSCGSLARGRDGVSTCAWLSDSPMPQNLWNCEELTSGVDATWELASCARGLRLSDSIWFRIIIVDGA